LFRLPNNFKFFSPQRRKDAEAQRRKGAKNNIQQDDFLASLRLGVDFKQITPTKIQ
jgi:hypothetical protein